MEPQETISSGDIENNTCRVYVNPNFKKSTLSANGSSKNVALMPRNVMHVNPNFSHFNANYKVTKIFVNPDFREKKDKLQSTYKKSDVQVSCSLVKEGPFKAVPHKGKSRYSLVRQDAKPGTSSTASSSVQVSNTYKLNKFKIIPIDDAKNDMKMKTMLLERQKTRSINRKSSFKFIKSLPEDMVTPHVYKADDFKPKPSCIKILETNKTKKVLLRKLKKNNLPCPLFRNYGKCIRNTRGHCEYLHDLKHISLCRKFIKGVCHDKDCTLSHDLSNKKMPTCYFYLKGICTKEGCPYLHVKLNDNTKICSEFLKGYCDQGENCMNKHINICPDLAMKRRCSNRQCIFHLKKVKAKTNLKKVKIPTKNSILKIKTNIDIDKKEEKQDGDTRYYKDVEKIESGNEGTEVIRPSRCKLGSLPSFIQL